MPLVTAPWLGLVGVSNGIGMYCVNREALPARVPVKLQVDRACVQRWRHTRPALSVLFYWASAETRVHTTGLQGSVTNWLPVWRACLGHPLTGMTRDDTTQKPQQVVRVLHSRVQRSR